MYSYTADNHNSALARESEDKVKFAAAMKWCKKSSLSSKLKRGGRCSVDYICTVMPVAFPFHNYYY